MNTARKNLFILLLNVTSLSSSFNASLLSIKNLWSFRNLWLMASTPSL